MDNLVFKMNCWFEGHVQGVGFRYQTVGVAKGFDVTGYVQNITDGRGHQGFGAAARRQTGPRAARGPTYVVIVVLLVRAHQCRRLISNHRLYTAHAMILVSRASLSL